MEGATTVLEMHRVSFNNKKTIKEGNNDEPFLRFLTSLQTEVPGQIASHEFLLTELLQWDADPIRLLQKPPANVTRRRTGHKTIVSRMVST